MSSKVLPIIKKINERLSLLELDDYDPISKVAIRVQLNAAYYHMITARMLIHAAEARRDGFYCDKKEATG